MKLLFILFYSFWIMVSSAQSNLSVYLDYGNKSSIFDKRQLHDWQNKGIQPVLGFGILSQFKNNDFLLQYSINRQNFEERSKFELKPNVINLRNFKRLQNCIKMLYGNTIFSLNKYNLKMYNGLSYYWSNYLTITSSSSNGGSIYIPKIRELVQSFSIENQLLFSRKNNYISYDMGIDLTSVVILKTDINKQYLVSNESRFQVSPFLRICYEIK